MRLSGKHSKDKHQRAHIWDRHVAGASAAALRGDLGAILVDTLAVEGEAAESAHRRK